MIFEYQNISFGPTVCVVFVCMMEKKHQNYWKRILWGLTKMTNDTGRPVTSYKSVESVAAAIKGDRMSNSSDSMWETARWQALWTVSKKKRKNLACSKGKIQFWWRISKTPDYMNLISSDGVLDYPSECIVLTVKHTVESVMIWVCASAKGVGEMTQWIPDKTTPKSL